MLVIVFGLAQTQPGRPALARAGAVLEVADPGAAAVRSLHARDEARDHRLHLLEDHRPV